jgi:hypothetical protein
MLEGYDDWIALGKALANKRGITVRVELHRKATNEEEVLLVAMDRRFYRTMDTFTQLISIVDPDPIE